MLHKIPNHDILLNFHHDGKWMKLIRIPDAKWKNSQTDTLSLKIPFQLPHEFETGTYRTTFNIQSKWLPTSIRLKFNDFKSRNKQRELFRINSSLSQI